VWGGGWCGLVWVWGAGGVGGGVGWGGGGGGGGRAEMGGCDASSQPDGRQGGGQPVGPPLARAQLHGSSPGTRCAVSC